MVKEATKYWFELFEQMNVFGFTFDVNFCFVVLCFYPFFSFPHNFLCIYKGKSYVQSF